MCEIVQRRCGELGVKIADMEANMSDEIMDLSYVAFEKLQKDSREFKVKMLSFVLADAIANHENLFFDKSNHMLECIDIIGVHHMAILELLFSKGVLTKEEKTWITIKELREEIKKINGVTDAILDDILIAAIADLVDKSLVKTKGESSGNQLLGINLTGLWYHTEFSISNLGEEFFEIIKCDSLDLNKKIIDTRTRRL